MLVTSPIVLLVDDEPDALESTRAALFREPYEIVMANSATQALAVLDTTDVSVVISDEKMPDMEGSELLVRVRREFPSVIRILLTGHASISSALKAINEGAVYRYLQKPVSADALSRVIGEALQEKTRRDLKEQVFEGARQQYGAMVSLAFSEDGLSTVRRRSERMPPRASSAPAAGGDDWERLSPRERDIVRRLREGNDAKEIASELGLSVHTVRNHLKAIYRKFNVRSQLEVVSRFSYRP